MINVLIVDDDKLVRMGLSSALPWADFGMRVIGEAANGEKALEFCEGHEVHLMMVDLSMPVMSGIDLMKICSERHREIRFVVLSFHQEISYVQEALRIGALDYITKGELEKENFPQILERVRENFRKSGRNSARPFVEPEEVLCIISLDSEGDVSWEERCPDRKGSWEIIDHGFWVFFPEETGELERLAGDLEEKTFVKRHWGFIRIGGMKGMDKADFFRQLRHYRYSSLFYDLDKMNGVVHRRLPLATDRGEPPEDIREDGDALIKSLAWSRDRGELESVLEQIRAISPPPVRLNGLLRNAAHDWNRVYGGITGYYVSEPLVFSCFLQVEEWMRHMTEETISRTVKLQVSPEILRGMEEAVKIIHRNYASNLRSEDVARDINMSRSYFYSCFADFTGKPFNEYLREVRLDRAAELLVKTGKTITVIAESVGYLDTKYFSGLFKERMGCTPVQYRKKGR